VRTNLKDIERVLVEVGVIQESDVRLKRKEDEEGDDSKDDHNDDDDDWD
jgi:hypothetical protein